MRLTVAFLPAAAMLAAAGCSDTGLERVVVSGRVTLNGKPVSNGEIRFRPIKGTRGPVSGSSIVDGAYTAEGLGGVPVGTYRVVIRGYRFVKATGSNSVEEGRFEQYLPAKYNEQSELEVTVESGRRKQQLDFLLE